MARIWMGRVCTIITVLFLLFDAVTKIIGEKHTVAQAGALGITANQLLGIGSVLLASLILYIIPRTAIFGALFLTAYLGGAVATNVLKGMPVGLWFFPVVFAIIVWLGLYLRDARLRQLVPVRAVITED